jgi:hypothetical protein
MAADPCHVWHNLFEQFQPFPTGAVFECGEAGRIAARPRKAFDEARADRIGNGSKDDRYGASELQQWPGRGTAGSQNHVRRQHDQFLSIFANARGITRSPTHIDPHIAADGPAQLRERLEECRHAVLVFGIVSGGGTKDADASHALPILPARSERPSCRAAEQRDELATLHSITSSARPSSVRGNVMPSALAVLRLMNSSTFVDCWTGRSAAFSPLRIRPV